MMAGNALILCLIYSEHGDLHHPYDRRGPIVPLLKDAKRLKIPIEQQDICHAQCTGYQVISHNCQKFK